MKKVLFLMLFLMILGTASFAQVRIGGNGVPHGATVLDLNADDTNNGTKTLALPRVSLTSTADKLGNTALLGGMLVYNTGGTISEGVYYWDGSQWVKPISTAYTGSTSVTLSGTSFQRAALTGDVTAAANSNATTIANDAVTSVKIKDGEVKTADLAANAVTVAKLPTGATGTTFLRGDGTWATPTDNNTTYTGSTSITLSGTSFQRPALTGDVTAAANNNATTIANDAVTSAKIKDGEVKTADLADNSVTTAKIVNGAVTAVKLNSMGATTAQTLVWNGTGWTTRVPVREWHRQIELNPTAAAVAGQTITWKTDTIGAPTDMNHCAIEPMHTPSITTGLSGQITVGTLVMAGAAIGKAVVIVKCIY